MRHTLQTTAYGVEDCLAMVWFLATPGAMVSVCWCPNTPYMGFISFCLGLESDY